MQANNKELQQYKKSYDRLKNQVGMLLNLEDSKTGELETVSDIYDIYKRIFDEYMREKKYPQEERKIFVDSLQKCEDYNGGEYQTLYRKLPQYLRDLKHSNGDSFFIVPSVILNHIFSYLIRKDSEHSFSVGIINKGLRPKNSPIVIEHFADKVKFNELVRLIQHYRPCTIESLGRAEINSTYIDFHKAFGNPRSIYFRNKCQTKGNCPVKEREFAIKCAWATRKCSYTDLLQSNKYPKWPIPTYEIHRRYIEILLEKYKAEIVKIDKALGVNLTKEITDMYKNYLKRKGLDKVLNIQFKANKDKVALNYLYRG